MEKQPAIIALNPLKCGGTALPANLLLMVKIVALALLLTNHVRLLPDPFLPFIPALDFFQGSQIWKPALQTVFVLAALAVLLNVTPRLSCLVLGGSLLLAVVSSKVYYGNNKTMCGLLLVLAGLYHERFGAWFLRGQMILTYFGAGLNKLLDPDWHSGVFFDFWAGQRLLNPIYLWGAALFPPLVLAKFFCYLTILTELSLPVLFVIRRYWFYAVWVSLLFHASLLEFTGTTFTMFFYAMEAAMLAFVAWPKEMIVIYDGDCGICNKIRRSMQRVDFELAFSWQKLQSGVGDRFGIPRTALEERLHFVADGQVYAGFRACKLILLYNPAFILICAALIAAPPADAAWYRRIVVGLLLAFFLPLFNPVGEWAYNWVARNRHRFSSDGACAININ